MRAVITVIGGDGIGPEVTAAVVEVLGDEQTPPLQVLGVTTDRGETIDAVYVRAERPVLLDQTPDAPWGAVALCGRGSLVAARDAVVQARLATWALRSRSATACSRWRPRTRTRRRQARKRRCRS